MGTYTPQHFLPTAMQPVPHSVKPGSQVPVWRRARPVLLFGLYGRWVRENPPKMARAARVWTFMMTTGLDGDWRKAIIVTTPLGDAG